MTDQNYVIENWTEDAGIYGSIIEKELRSFKREAWVRLITSEAPAKECLEILDVGTGPGFFATILTLAGHHVTAVDCTEAMIEKAEKNAADFGAHLYFRVEDAHSLSFCDERFDLVISRNVTWTLLEPERAYLEWNRVLKPNGKILIFDANWNLRFFNESYAEAYRKDEQDYFAVYGKKVHQDPDEEKMNAFRRSVPMSSRLRPDWDLAALEKLGFEKVTCVRDITDQVWDEEEKIKYRSRPMFMISIPKRPAGDRC